MSALDKFIADAKLATTEKTGEAYHIWKTFLELAEATRKAYIGTIKHELKPGSSYLLLIDEGVCTFEDAENLAGALYHEGVNLTAFYCQPKGVRIEIVPKDKPKA